MFSVQKLVINISHLSKGKPTFFIAMDGVAGGGKSTLAKHLLKVIPGIKIIEMDDFYDPVLDRTEYERVREEVLVPLRNGKAVIPRIYDWKTKKLIKGKKIEPKGIFVVEGVYSMEKSITELYDYKIWVDCPVNIGLKRGIQRDKNEYGVYTTDKWMNIWVPDYIKYMKTQNPSQKADILLDYKDISKFVEN